VLDVSDELPESLVDPGSGDADGSLFELGLPFDVDSGSGDACGAGVGVGLGPEEGFGGVACANNLEERFDFLFILISPLT